MWYRRGTGESCGICSLCVATTSLGLQRAHGIWVGHDLSRWACTCSGFASKWWCQADGQQDQIWEDKLGTEDTLGPAGRTCVGYCVSPRYPSKNCGFCFSFAFLEDTSFSFGWLQLPLSIWIAFKNLTIMLNNKASCRVIHTILFNLESSRKKTLGSIVTTQPNWHKIVQHQQCKPSQKIQYRVGKDNLQCM